MGDDFASLARRLLHEAGYSMKAAARALNYDPAYLSRALNGKQKPSLKLATALDQLLAANGALAATVLDDEEQARVSRSAANPSRLDAGTVDALAGVLAAYRRLDDSADPRTLTSAVVAQAKDVTGLLRGARGPHRDRLAEVAAEWTLFAGWVFAQQRQDAKAVRLLNEAVDLADDAQTEQSGELVSAAWNFRGYVARQQDRPQGVARWFSAAADVRGAHPAQRQGDLLQAAAGLAQLGQRDDALRLVDQAEGLTDQAAALPPPAVAYWLSGAFGRLNLAIAHMGLGRHGDAVDHFTAGLAGLPPDLRSAPWTAEHRGHLARSQALR
ncbi:helix-turn-helix domain-containing protein [Streptomyces scabiei]|uniref:helix-turn-helix domain-containing protein n=1 Tax=Streptomyces scabiei TaxID=1930 RepID=UPI0037A134E1